MTDASSAPGLRVSAEELIRLRHRARNLNLTGKVPVTSVIAGVHTSRFRGRGVDFLESRNYEIGDDFRDLDWKVTARTGKPHTKVFQEERERPVITLVDFNPSMYFGTRVRLKTVQAARLAAVVGWAAVRRGDRIGGLIYRGDTHHEVRPAGGRRGVLRFIRLLSQWSESYAPSDFTEPDSGLDQALKRLRRVARPGSLVFLISDFFAAGPECERHLAYLRKHNDVIACHVCDAVELDPPPPASYPVSDGVHSGVLDLHRSGTRSDYRDFFQHNQAVAIQAMRKQGVPRLVIRTEEDAADAISRMFRQREAA